MLRWLFCLTFIFSNFLCYVAGNRNDYSQMCTEKIPKSLSCNTRLAGPDAAILESDVCKVKYYAYDSDECKKMNFGPFDSGKPFDYNIGGVSLKPYILDSPGATSYNFTLLNITFTNIKWKTMKFRFLNVNRNNYHCQNIVISNDVRIDDRSVLYYDCYWSQTDGDTNGTSHYLDFEASDDYGTNRGRYYFNIPTMQMLSTTVRETEWKPFLYIEPLHTLLRLHIMPPPPQLKIKGYKIEIVKGCSKGTMASQCTEVVVDRVNKTLHDRNAEVTYESSFLRRSGSHYFVVTPLHDACNGNEPGCQSVASPKIDITTDTHETLSICVASVTALIVASLFAYYIVLRMIRRYWCKDYRLANGHEIPPPTKVLVIYPNGNRLHAECVISFVTYLRSEYGFDIMYDGDIVNTNHRDPFIWAQETFTLASHIMYIVGPAEDSNAYTNIYEKQIIPAHKNVDLLLLNMVRAVRGSRCSKHICNVYFEHSNGQVPIETKHSKSFYLLNDWHKMITYLSKNLIPKKQLLRTEKGKSFLEDLTRAKKLLIGNRDNVIVKCEDVNSFDKKILV